MNKIVLIVAFWGNSENSDGNGGKGGVLNSNHGETGREKNVQGPQGFLGFPRGIHIYKLRQNIKWIFSRFCKY